MKIGQVHLWIWGRSKWFHPFSLSCHTESHKTLPWNLSIKDTIRLLGFEGIGRRKRKTLRRESISREMVQCWGCSIQPFNSILIQPFIMCGVLISVCLSCVAWKCLSQQGSLKNMEWVAILFSRGSSWPRDRTWVSRVTGRFFTIWAMREAPLMVLTW